jgi:UDP-N-acetylglucosamine 2-epimerase (non-hydrolysing)
VTGMVHLVIGARPNLMKIAPLYHELSRSSQLKVQLIYTGQHSSAEMSQVFFELFSLPKPDYSLSEVSGSQSHQIAQIMDFYDEVVQKEPPSICVVVGDVTSSLACALVASKIGIPIAHVEAGLRSRDRSMPEEINRLVIDVLADILYTPSADANANLLAENKPIAAIHMVGNIMIDSFEMMKDAIKARNLPRRLGLVPGSYGVVTFHRPANVDDSKTLDAIIGQLLETSQEIPLIFPIHPRTKSKIVEFGLSEYLQSGKITICEPLDYLDFMSLVLDSKMVITDSGGIQEETTYLGIPCLTVRENTERPITISDGSNQLVHIGDLARTATEAIFAPHQVTKIPPLWDGMTAGRIVKHMESFLAGTGG